MIGKCMNSGKLNLCAEAIPMGDGWNVSLTGGEKPHIGAVALAIPRPSLKTAGKISATVSVLAVTGHKEDEFAKKAAHFLSSALNLPVVVVAGIHIDNIKKEEIKGFEKLLTDLLDDLIKDMKRS